jgi:hypothetical protein
VAALAPEALHLGDRHALHTDVGDGLPHFIELERLDDGGNELHATDSGGRRGMPETSMQEACHGRIGRKFAGSAASGGGGAPKWSGHDGGTPHRGAGLPTSLPCGTGHPHGG